MVNYQLRTAFLYHVWTLRFHKYLLITKEILKIKKTVIQPFELRSLSAP